MGNQLSIKNVVALSHRYYKIKPKRGKNGKKLGGDNKRRRAKLDVLNARIINRNNYDYNRSTKKWEQTGQKIRIEFLIRTKPISYRKTDTINTHRFPVTFIIDDLDKGINSTFRWRTGSLKKPIIATAGQDSKKIANLNIKRGIQLQFFFELEFVLKQAGLLYGRCWAKRPPKITNPKRRIFFDKHSWMLATSFLVRMLNTNGGAVKGLIIANKKK